MRRGTVKSIKDLGKKSTNDVVTNFDAPISYIVQTPTIYVPPSNNSIDVVESLLLVQITVMIMSLN